ncbi:hypothetical protein MYMA111404_01445 [Mycoplasma marinum]|uniref:Uncharacterized protein n=1 Tax=Mycoplasma marinum TaxID=1937190 RepID=A0A4R0XUL7_9MOLU|nr:hypothetical protein [Mycoplasma marinum]TCG11497.1 hypothetical protein C4B24_01935 [Mycoplasma marinum]
MIFLLIPLFISTLGFGQLFYKHKIIIAPFAMLFFYSAFSIFDFISWSIGGEFIIPTILCVMLISGSSLIIFIKNKCWIFWRYILVDIFVITFIVTVAFFLSDIFFYNSNDDNFYYNSLGSGTSFLGLDDHFSNISSISAEHKNDAFVGFISGLSGLLSESFVRTYFTIIAISKIIPLILIINLLISGKNKWWQFLVYMIMIMVVNFSLVYIKISTIAQPAFSISLMMTIYVLSVRFENLFKTISTSFMVFLIMRTSLIVGICGLVILVLLFFNKKILTETLLLSFLMAFFGICKAFFSSENQYILEILLGISEILLLTSWIFINKMSIVKKINYQIKGFTLNSKIKIITSSILIICLMVVFITIKVVYDKNSSTTWLWEKPTILWLVPVMLFIYSFMYKNLFSLAAMIAFIFFASVEIPNFNVQYLEKVLDINNLLFSRSLVLISVLLVWPFLFYEHKTPDILGAVILLFIYMVGIPLQVISYQNTVYTFKQYKKQKIKPLNNYFNEYLKGNKVLFNELTGTKLPYFVPPSSLVKSIFDYRGVLKNGSAEFIKSKKNMLTLSSAENFYKGKYILVTKNKISGGKLIATENIGGVYENFYEIN